MSGNVKKKMIVVGSGAREHALSLALCPGSEREVSVVPGNAGMAHDGLLFLPSLPEDVREAASIIEAEKPTLVIVGPEKPLVSGLVDCLRERSVPVVGPTAEAARIEGSKLFAKEVMSRSGIPTAPFHEVVSAGEVREQVRRFGYPAVLKEDGLAQGKGVWVLKDDSDLGEVISRYFDRDGKKPATGRIFVEKGLSGPEVSYIVMTDGERFIPFPSARDFKRIGDGDTGPNTGGMGALTPVPGWNQDDEDSARGIIERVLWGLKKNQTPFTGFLYAGLMKTPEGIMVLEFNARFGDPEAQVLLPQAGEGFPELMEELSRGTLPGGHSFVGVPTVGVVLASPGYPEKPVTGGRILGIEKVRSMEDVRVYSAGIALANDSERDMVSAGGRVLTVTGSGKTLTLAREKAYEGIRQISLPGGQYRTDIALKEVRDQG